MECMIGTPTKVNAKHIININGKKYTLVIGELNSYHIIILSNDSSSISFRIDDYNTTMTPEDFYRVLDPNQKPYTVNKYMIWFFGRYVLVNEDNMLKIYDGTTLFPEDTIQTKYNIKAINVTSQYIILDCSFEKDGRVQYHYELYSMSFRHINTINYQIMFIDNSRVQNNLFVFADNNITTKLNSKYLLYDVEENMYMRIDNAQISLENCMLISSTYRHLNVISPKEEMECSVCYDPIMDVHALVPCGHVSLCTKCYIEQKTITCPICRKHIDQRIKIYK